MESIEKMKASFLQYVAGYASGLNEGSGKKANRYQKRIVELHRQATELNCDDLFINFLDSKDEYVKYWATIFCEDKYPDLAKKSYLDLVNSSEPIIRLSAKEYLKHH